ncbi:LPXTG cell wall anchor domain-containing protein [Arthrobacter sp. ZGTC131]|uniref:LPXTG cell wall anchor domain-containing protein n=1 Tax=Arthrobacter sp. ZGTC131 TaxID=2058898 RepID=UPI000CE32139|nr:LPXTG cell wall anchor domain-containing protein [Arthrobacter sp. ZGTC131]
MKKSIAALALAGTIALTGAVPAMAARYPAPPLSAAVSDGTVGPGETFTFSGRGFLAGERLTITVRPGARPASTGASIAGGGASRAVPSKINVLLAPETYTTTADANGAFAFPMSISKPGVYALTATGATSGITTPVVTIRVAPGLANTGGNNGGNAGVELASTGTGLANTGADSSLILWSLVGGGALVAGAASVVVVRRRANADASA